MKVQGSLIAAFAAASFATTAAAQTAPEEPQAPASPAAQAPVVATSDALAAVPDRPTFSFAPVTVQAGHAQLEGGVEFASSEAGSTLAIPVLVRLGIAPSFELRAGLPAPVIGLGADSDSELGALQLGGKVAGNVSDTVSLGMLPFFNIASNSGESTVFSQSDLGTIFLWGLQFGDFGVSGNLGVVVGPGGTEESGPREFFFPVSLAASYALGDLGITAEGFAVAAEVADTNAGTQLALNYFVTDTFVVDLYGGAGLAGDLPDAWVGLGATFAK